MVHSLKYNSNHILNTQPQVSMNDNNNNNNESMY